MPQAQRRDCSCSLPKNISTSANDQTLIWIIQVHLKENYATTKKQTLTKSKAALNFRANELTCVSFSCWRATEAVRHSGFSSAQVTVMQCIVGCSNYSSLSSSHSHVPLSRNSTFCLATAIPQMQSGWQRTITVQHQVTMTTTIYLICISCLHYRLMPNMVNFHPPPPSLPCTSSLPPFLQQRALASRLVYTDINASFFFFFFTQDVSEKRKRSCQWDQFGSWAISGETAA